MTRRPVHAAGMVVAETTAPEGQPVTAADLAVAVNAHRRLNPNRSTDV